MFTPFAFVKSVVSGPPIVYMSATGGNTVVTDGNFKIHYFTSAGTFTVNTSGKVEIYAVAGGGGGGEAGGGGGGVIAITDAANYTLPTASYSITIGAGGNAFRGTIPVPGSNGGNTTIGTVNLTAVGGGRGGTFVYDGSFSSTGANGGSGGGSNNTTYSTGSQPTQAGDSGLYGFGNSGMINGGGGGGASAAATGSNGAEGYSISLYAGDTPVTRVLGSGGAGAGGVGGTNAGNSTAGQRNATANFGGGGGSSGSPFTDAGTGGSGIVIFKYQFQG